MSTTRRISPILEKLRGLSGLLLMAYALGHFLNHGLGIVSIESMDRAREAFTGFWRSDWIFWLLPLALLIHMVTAVALTLHRRNLGTLDRLGKIQISLGFLIPLFLLQHITFTRIAYMESGRSMYYASFFADAPKELGSPAITFFFLTFVLAIVWYHGCLGIHRWLRLKAWYRRRWLSWYTMALMPPVLAAFGIAGGLREAKLRALDPNWQQQLISQHQFLDSQGQPVPLAESNAILEVIATQLVGVYLVSIVLAFCGRWLWLKMEQRKAVVPIRYDAGTEVRVPPGTTILDASRLAGVPHASVCGGNGRCSTCRTRILVGAEALPSPSTEEAGVLERIGAPPNVRLACQVRPLEEVCVHPLLKQGNLRDTGSQPAYANGEEIDVTLMFADLRGFTQLSDQRLPYDVVFILNQYFEVMGEAIESNDGYLDKFIGDGIMAIFGIQTGPAVGAKQALGAAIRMGQRLEELNARLEGQLDEPLRIGIGLHRGHAIVGKMGYSGAKSVTAIGGAVNTAARLEGASKELNAQLAVSQEVLDAAGVDLPGLDAQTVMVRGRAEPVQVYAVREVGTLKPLKRKRPEALPQQA